MSLRRTASTLALGGLVWAVVPLVDDLAPALQATFWLAPVALLVGVVGLVRADLVSRSTALVLGAGFGLATVVGLAVLGLFVRHGSLATAPFAAGVALFPLGIAALVVAFVGEALLARDLWGGPVPRALVGFLPLSIPLDLAFNALVAPLVGHGLSIGGLAWIALGAWLWRAVGDRPVGDRGVASASPAESG